MSFLDKPISELSIPELQRLIRSEISRQVPPIPAGLLSLADFDNPLVAPAAANNAEALVFNSETGRWGNGKITAESLEAVFGLVSALFAGTLGAARVEVGYGIDDEGELDTSEIGIRAYTSDGVTATLSVDALTGQVYVRGRFDFGTGSRLLVDDSIELAQQPDAVFQEPVQVQTKKGAGSNLLGGSSGAAAWTSPTTTGNLLLMAVAVADLSATPPTITTPAGWTLVGSVLRNDIRLSVFKIESAASRSGAQTVNFSAGADGWAIFLHEYSGVEVQDVTDTDSANSGSPSSGRTATTTQDEELWFAAILSDDAGDQTAPTDFFDVVQEHTLPAGVNDVGRLETYERFVTAAGEAGLTTTVPTARDHVGVVVTFKAKAVGVEAPETGKARIYAEEVDGAASLHVVDELGAVHRLAEGAGHEVQELINNATGVNMDGGSRLIESADVTLPTGWTSMDVLLTGKVQINNNSGGDHRFVALLESPSGTQLNQAQSGMAIATAAFLAEAMTIPLTGALSGLTATQAVRIMAWITGGTTTLGDCSAHNRHLMALKIRRS